jgi:hypothetical protein
VRRYNQPNLYYQQKDPGGEDRAVNVDDQTRQRRTKDAGKKIGSSESHQHRSQDQERHAGKREIFPTTLGF